MKRLFTLLTIAALILALPIAAQNSSRPAQEVGSQVLSNPSSSTALTVPSNAQWALISVRTAGIHVSFDGTASTTNDLYIAAGTVLAVEGNLTLSGIRVINSSDGSAVVYVKYFRQR